MARRAPTFGLTSSKSAAQSNADYDHTRRRHDPALSQAAKIRNSAAWRAARAAFKQRHPCCCDPFHEHGPLTVTEHLHHIKPLGTHPEIAFDETNCAPLCVGCHNKIEGMERRGIVTSAMFIAYIDKVRSVQVNTLCV